MKILTSYLQKNKKLSVLLIFILSLSVRLIYGLWHYNKWGTRFFSDGWEYISYAKNILIQGIFVTDISRLSEFSPRIDSSAHVIGPVYPMILAPLIAIFNDNYISLIILNALASGLISVVLYYLGKMLFDERVGLISALWSIIYWPFISYVPHIYKESILILFFTLLFLLVFQVSKQDKINLKLFVLAVLFALIIHMDERYLIYLPFVCFILLIFDNKNYKTGFIKATLFGLLVLVLMIPWTIRNYIVYNKVVLLTERTSHITDKLLGYESEKISFVEKNNNIYYLSSLQIDSCNQGLKYHFSNGLKIESGQLEAMKKGIIPRKFTPVEIKKAIFKSLWEVFDFTDDYISDGYRFDAKAPLKRNIGVGITFGLLLPFMFVGLIYLAIKKKRIFIFFAGLFFYHTLIHILFIPFTQTRFRYPIDGFIVIIGIYGILIVYDYFRNLRLKKISQDL